MRVFRGVETYDRLNETCLTTGTFDGVHIGHRKIIDLLNQTARSQGRRSVMLTFHPHPRKVLFPDDHGLRLLTTMEEKLALFEKAGLDDIVIQPFSLDFSRMDSIEYVRDLLVANLNMKHMVIGYDHHFGRNREGNIDQLKELAPLYDFKVEEIPAQDIDDVNVSSTKIRRALESGEVDIANSFLGYRYSFEGEVIHGKKRGGEIGFPTANIHVTDDTKLIPCNGVYQVNVEIGEVKRLGMMNIGTNPTFESGKERSIEVHLFDFDGSIYGQSLRIELVKYLREEQRFGSKEALIEQMKKDEIRARNI